jgi:hypothetical protein
MVDRDNREEIFNMQLAGEVARNKDAIEKILHNSKVGQCGGKCNGFISSIAEIEEICKQMEKVV